jgi:hypothetical protein
MQTNTSATNNKLAKDTFITSYCKRVKDTCKSLTKGTSKLTNRIFYFFSKNSLVGLYYVILTTKALADYLDCHPSMISLYIKEAVKQDLFTVEKLRGKKGQHLWKFIPTEKLLRIKKDGTVIPQSSHSFFNLTSENPKSNTPETSFSTGDSTASLYRSNICLNTAQECDKTFSDVVKEEKKIVDVEKSIMGRASEKPPARRTLTPNQRAAMKARKASFRAKKIEERQAPATTEEQAQCLLALAYIKAFAEQYQLIDSLKIIDEKFLKAFLPLLRSHFGTADTFLKYISLIATIPYLMGKKTMTDGNTFTLSVGFILKAENIEMSWERMKYFDVWQPKNQEEEDMAIRKQAQELPTITLEDVQSTGQSILDTQVKTKLYQLLGEPAYKSWIHPNGFVALGVSQGEPMFNIANAFVAGILRERFGEQLNKAFQC